MAVSKVFNITGASEMELRYERPPPSSPVKRRIRQNDKRPPHAAEMVAAHSTSSTVRLLSEYHCPEYVSLGSLNHHNHNVNNRPPPSTTHLPPRVAPPPPPHFSTHSRAELNSTEMNSAAVDPAHSAHTPHPPLQCDSLRSAVCAVASRLPLSESNTLSPYPADTQPLHSAPQQPAESPSLLSHHRCLVTAAKSSVTHFAWRTPRTPFHP